MKILIAEDDKDTLMMYKLTLEGRGHLVELAIDGKDCLDKYHRELVKVTSDVTTIRNHSQPFDVMLLDYKIPLIDGMEVAREILAVNPHQRIIFASAYVRETLLESVKQLNQVVELLQKPFEPGVLIDQIEDKEIYSELQNLNVDIETLKRASLRHEQLEEFLATLREIHKRRTF